MDRAKYSRWDGPGGNLGINPKGWQCRIPALAQAAGTARNTLS